MGQAQKNAFLSALEESMGLVNPAARKSNISRTNHYNWMKSDEAYRRAVEELNEVVLDFAEEKLFNLIDDGDTTATIFLLKCRGKKRGYIERLDMTTNGNDLPPINIIMPKMDGE